MISRTTDGGRTWSTPEGDDATRTLYAQGNQIVVLPDGTLLDIQAMLFKGAGNQPNLNGVYMAVMRSKDGGKHWSAPSQIAQIRTVGVSADGQPLRVGDYLPDIAVDPASGDVYVTWADGLGGPTNKIVMAAPSDGGKHWSTPQRRQPPRRGAVVQPRGRGGQRRRARRPVLRHRTGTRRRPRASRPTSTCATPATAGRHGAPADADDVRLREGARSPAATSSATTRASPRSAPQGMLAFFGVAGATAKSANVYSIRLTR